MDQDAGSGRTNQSRREEPLLWTVKDLAYRLQLKPSTLYAWAAQGKIPFLKIHGLLRFRPEEIAQWAASFHQQRCDLARPSSRNVVHNEINDLIARARREVYSARHGETITPSPTGKE